MEEDKNISVETPVVDEEVTEARKQIADDLGINLAEDDTPDTEDDSDETTTVPDKGEQSDKTETPATTVADQTPAKILGKFNSQDDLIKSYQELEKKLGQKTVDKETEQYAQVGKEFAQRLQNDADLQAWYKRNFGGEQPQPEQKPAGNGNIKDLEAIKPLIDEAVKPYRQTLEEIQAERLSKQREQQIQEIKQFDETYGKDLSDDETNDLMRDAIQIRLSPKFANEPLSKSLERAYFDKYPDKMEQQIKLKAYAEMKEGQMASLPAGQNGGGAATKDSGAIMDKDLKSFYEGLGLNPDDLAK